jgi:hypothetical protein
MQKVRGSNPLSSTGFPDLSSVVNNQAKKPKRSWLLHMQVRLPVAVAVPGNGAGAPQRALDVTSCGYPPHPFGTVHAKIIFSMKANGVLDFDINELGCISRDLGVLL